MRMESPGRGKGYGVASMGEGGAAGEALPWRLDLLHRCLVVAGSGRRLRTRAPAPNGPGARNTGYRKPWRATASA